MRFIRDIINEKRGHSSPDDPARHHDDFAPEIHHEEERLDGAPKGHGQHEQNRSLGQGHIDESALRNIFMDAEPVEAEPPQPVDAAQDEEIEALPDAFRFSEPGGLDLTGPLGSAFDQDDEPDHERPHAEQPVQDHMDAPRPAQTPEIPEAPEAPMASEPPPRVQPHAQANMHAQSDAPYEDAAPVEMPQPAAGRSLGRSGRVKTRVLGFGQPQDPKLDVFKAKAEQAPQTPSTYPVGWLVVVDGPGQGSAFTLHDGVASIGRGADQTVALAFGDNSISRENHAAIAYDEEQRSFFLGHGGKTNLVRLNGRPVLSTEELKSDDLIRIGETTLRFVALCGAKFSWSQVQKSGAGHVAAE